MLIEMVNKLFGRAPHDRTEQREASLPTFERLEDRLLLSLIGVNLEFPQMPYDATGIVNYDATTQAFDSDATPLAIRFAATEAAVVMPPRDFQLHIQVDNAGNLIGGVAGDDLYIEGQIDRDRDGVIDYDGVLLTGEVLEFGHLDSGGPTDQYDFRFVVTGGDLAPLYAGMDIGISMISPNSTFTGDFGVNFGGMAQGVLGAIEPLAPPQTSTLAGRVFHDADNDGVDDGEAGIGGVTVTLSGAADMTTTTAADGSYSFADLLPGNYIITESQPIDFLDGIGDDVLTVAAAGEDVTGLNFAEILPASVSGLVWEDFNADGAINFNEYAIEGVLVTLTGVDDRGDAVELTDVTDSDGVYALVDLRPGEYTITETQPAGYEDGVDVLGEVDGVPVGVAGNDVFTEVALDQNQDGVNYNFSERAAAGSTVVAGQTATIGFWQNKNGQGTLASVNEGLGDWLAATLPNLYGVNAGANDLTGLSNTEVAALYKARFKAHVKARDRTTIEGPAKVDCQVMATAFAVYVTNENLAGTGAEAFGFMVTIGGVGVALWDVGDAGVVFGVDDYTEMTVLDLLLATDERAVDGVLYADFDVMYRILANKVYTAINEGGDI